METKNIFGRMLIIFLIIAIIVMSGIFSILKKKGIDIYSSKVQLKVILYVIPIILIPIWFFNPISSFNTKLIGSIIAVVAVINFIAVDKGGRVLRHILGIKEK